MHSKVATWAALVAAATFLNPARAASFELAAELPFAARDVVFDSLRGLAYLSQAESNRVWRVEVETGAIDGAFEFTFKPGPLALSPDGQSLAVLFPAAPQSYVQVIDLNAQVASPIAALAIDPADVLLRDDGILVVSGIIGTARTFRASSGEELGWWPVGSRAQLVMDSTQTNIYAIGQETLRRLILNPLTGALSMAKDLSYYAGTNLFLHPNGTNLITQGGLVFSTAIDPATDLLMIRNLPFRVQSAAFDPIENAFFAGTITNVIYCNAMTFEPIRQFPETNSIKFLHLQGSSLLCVSVGPNRTTIKRMPNPATGASTNTPPVPAFTWSPDQPDALRRTTFDARNTSDAQDTIEDMVFRWDWDSDGTFDTLYASAPTNTHLLSAPGIHRITMEVMDSRGMTARVTRELDVVLAQDPGTVAPSNLPFSLPFEAADAVIRPDGTHAYVTDPIGKRVVELDLATGVISRQFECALSPAPLALSPGGRFLYAGLTPGWPRSYQRPYTWGAVQEFDLVNRIRIRDLEIGADPFDLAVTEDTLILSPATSQVGPAGYYIDTARPRTNFYVGAGLRLSAHPSGHAFYGADTGSIPSDIIRYNFGPAGISNAYDSPYHGNYPMDGKVFVHPGGELVFTAGGGVFRSSDVQEDDMQFVLLLEGRRVEDMFFDLDRKAFFTIAGTNVCHYHAETFAVAGRYPTPVGGQFILGNSNSLFAFCVQSNRTLVLSWSNPAVGGESNAAPVARFDWQPVSQSPLVLRFDASPSSDDRSSGELQFRWDFDDDGVFDTEYARTPLESREFALPGSRFITLEVKDRHGATSSNRQRLDFPITLADPAPGSVDALFEVPMAATAAVYDPRRPYLYCIHEATRRLFRVNLTNGLVDANVQFDYPPSAIAVNAQGSHLYVSLRERSWGQSNPTSHVAEFDLAGAFQYRTFPVAMDVYAMAATDNRMVIVSGYATSIANVASYRASTGELLGQGYAYHNCDLALHPAENSVFLGERYLSPSTIIWVQMSPVSGIFTNGAGIGSSGGTLYPNPDGTSVLTAWGTVYTTNGIYVGRLEHGSSDAVWFDGPRHALFTAADGTLSFYNSKALERTRSFPVTQGTRYVGGWNGFVYATAIDGQQMVVQRLLSPALGGETNTPPQVAFTWTPQTVRAFETVTFDASGTTDTGSALTNLLYRWDWDSDGVFDTEFSPIPTVNHRFSIARSTSVTLQVKDPLGAIASLQKSIPVSAGSDPGSVVTHSSPNAFDITLQDAVFDPIRPYVYAADVRSNRIVFINLTSGLIEREFPLEYPPECMAITPSGSFLYVAELLEPHNFYNGGPYRALVDEFDLQTRTRTRQFEIQEDPFDLIATDDFLVVSGGSGQANAASMRSYRRTTGQELFRLPTPSGQRIVLHPDRRSFYGSTTWSSSSQVRRFTLNPTTGAIAETVLRSGVDHWSSPGLVINPFGTNLVSSRGNVLVSSDDPAKDLTITRVLDFPYFLTALFVPSHNAFYSAGGTSLNLYDWQTFDQQYTYVLPGNARFLGTSSNRLYALCDTSTNTILSSRLLPITTPASNMPPSLVQIIAPENASVINLPGVLEVQAAVDDADGWIERVDVYIGLAFLGSATNPPYRVTWTNPPSGVYPLSAVAYDNWGASAWSDPVFVSLNQRPVATIESPISGTVHIHHTPLTVSVSAQDPDGSIQRVELFVNGTFTEALEIKPFAFVLPDLPLGTNRLDAIAFDDQGSPSLTSTIQVRVVPALPNDPFAGAIALNGTNLSVTASTFKASKENGEPNHAGDPGGRSLWWKWTAPFNGTVEMNTLGSDYDTVFAVYSGNALSQLLPIAANDDHTGPFSRVKFTANAGATYYIAVDGNNGAGGNLQFSLTASRTTANPLATNDFFVDRAILLSPGNSALVLANNSAASGEQSEMPHVTYSTPAHSLWWQWTAPSNGSVKITTFGSDFDTVLAVYVGETISSLSPVANNDDAVANLLSSAVEFNVSAGTRYSIAVDGFRHSSGNVSLALNFSPQPVDTAVANDLFAQRKVVTNRAFFDVAFNTHAAWEPLEPAHFGSPAGKSLWWSWIPTASGRARISTKGSSFDTVLAVYTGPNLFELEELASNDNPDPETQQAAVEVDVVAGTEYHIAVDGNAGGSGRILLSAGIPETGESPANDQFANRASLEGDHVRVEASNSGATREPNEPIIQGNAGGRSVWWTWTAPANGILLVTTAGSEFDTLLGVYSGSDLGALEAVGTNDDDPIHPGSRVKVPVVAGGQYHVSVDGFDGASGALILELLFVPDYPGIPNDHFANRAFLSGSSNFVEVSTFAASREELEPEHAGKPGGRSLWWTWTAPHSGPVSLSTEGSDFDTLLAVYEGAVINSSSVASNDDANASVRTSFLTFDAVSNVTYNLAVDGFAGAAGQLRLTLIADSTAVPSPGNDMFANRIRLFGPAFALMASNVGATGESGELTLLPVATPIRSVWWSWTAPASGRAELSTKGSDFDTVLSVYTGDSLESLVRIAGNDDESEGTQTSKVVFEATAGTEYQIQVDGRDDACGNIALTLSAPAALGFRNVGRTSAGAFRFEVDGPQQPFTIETSVDLLRWTPLLTNTPPFEFIHSTDPGGARFFRIR